MPRLLALAPLLVIGGCVPAERPPSERSAGGGIQATESPRPPRPALPATGVEAVAVAQLADGGDAPLTDAEEPPLLPTLTATFEDRFERENLGDAYWATGDQYRIQRGELCVKAAQNHPLWLRHRLPTNARIEVEARSGGPDGDIKLEAWGDGRGAASGPSYTNATSYLAIFGGWKNRYHVLARMDEHAADRPEIVIEPGSDDPRREPVVAGRRYRLKLERTDGHTLRFWVDDVEMLSFSDPHPLSGGGHDHFGFNDWQTPVCFDNLRVEPLPG